MGASFEGPVKTDLLIKSDLKSELLFKNFFFWIFELGKNLFDIYFVL
jgi:hypothetical protein